MKLKFYLTFGCLVLLAFNAFSQNVVISEVYGGGGNTGAIYKNDFIELYNPTNSPVSLAGWSVQYAAAAGTTWAVTNLTGTIAAKSYYLIQEVAGTGGTVNLPTPDVVGTIAMAGTAGKVALVNLTSALSGTCPSDVSIVDFVGFGTTANCFEGSGTTTAPSNTASVERKANAASTSGSMSSGGTDELAGNGYDSNNNTNDFVSRSPQPQNSASTTEPVDLPPTFTSTYPKTINITSSGFDVVTNLNEPGKTYLVVLADNATAPTSAQVKNGQDASSNALVPSLVSLINVTSAASDFSVSISSLSPDTNYDVYVVAEDLIPNLQASPVKIDVKTNVAGDVTPPTFTSGYPSINSILPTGFTVTTNLDELGKTYFVVLASGATAPSSLQVKSGQDAGSNTLASNLVGTINVTSAASEFTSAVTGLNSSTAYDVYVVAEDNVPNLQASPSKLIVSTETQFVENFNTCDGTASFTHFSITGAQVWGCTDFGRASSKGMRMNGFAGTSKVNEDWLISPVVTLNANANLSFYSQFSFTGNVLQLKISTNYTGSGDPAIATWTDLSGNFPTVAVASTSTALSDWTLSTVDLSAYNAQTVYVAFVYASTSLAASRWTVDEITFNQATASYLDVSPSALLFTAGGAVKNYSVKGNNLTNDVSINAPASFTISKDNTTFSNSITFTASEVATTKSVYVKFTVVTGSTDTFTGSISNVSIGVATKGVSVKGTDKTQTLDIATYNLEFFGTDVKNTGGTEFGPIDDALQISNVTNVLQTISADIYGVQEVSDDNAFNQLVANLPGYSGILSNKWSYSFNLADPNFPPQKVGFIYNNSTVQLVNSRVMFSQMYDDIRAGSITLPGYPTTSSSFWSSGRLPLMTTFEVTINGIKKIIRVIDIHSKSGSALADYNRRKYDVKVLHDSLVANYANANIVLLGDYNDDVDNSIATGQESSYKAFVDNTAHFNVLTYALSQTAGVSTFPNSNSFLDHIITSNELTNAYVSNSITVEDARTYIPNYVNTTSDHLPVSARFVITKANQTITFNALPIKTFGDAAFTISATTTSGLAVAFTSSDPAIASVNGSSITILKAGSVNITASQAGDASFNTATEVVQSLTIGKANQTITFNALPTKTFGDAAFTLSATASSSLPVSQSTITTSKISITGSEVTLLAAGQATITASQAGDANFNAASDVSQTFCINPPRPTITLSKANTEIPTLTSSAAAGNQWYKDGSAIAGATNTTLNVAAPGIYSVEVIVETCKSARSTDQALIVTGDISHVSGQEQLTIHPNPTSDFITMQLPGEGNKEIKILGVNGVTVESRTTDGEETTWDVRQYAPGYYLVRVSTNRRTYYGKFIKK